MKTLCKGLLLAAVVAFVGCAEKSPPGGPGAAKSGTTPAKPGDTTRTTPPAAIPGDRPADTPDRGTASRDTGLTTPENTFRIEVPRLETDIKQGESKTVTVGIDRGKNFDQDVRLEVSGAPKGVTVTPASPMIKAADKNVQLTIQAAKDAALGEHEITVTATPAKQGAKTSAKFQIQVKEAS
jgi:hypothetical protein